MKKLALGLLAILLASCSSSSKKVEPYTQKLITSDNSTIEVIYGFGKIGEKPTGKNSLKENFRIITRGHTAGKAVFNGVVGGILCNPLSLLPCNWGDLGFSKENLEGDVTNITNLSRTYAYPKYIELLKNNLNFSTTRDYSPVPIYFYGDDNYLIYDNDTYKLKIGFSIYPYNSSIDNAFKCTEEKTGISYDEWVANNYALAVTNSKKLIDKCFERLDHHHFERVREILEQTRKNFL